MGRRYPPRSECEEQVRLARQLGRPAILQDHLDNLAGACHEDGDFSAAISYYKELISVLKGWKAQSGYDLGIERAYRIIIDIYRDDLNDYNSARWYLKELREYAPGKYSNDVDDYR